MCLRSLVGLGVGTCFNKALFAKWIWRFAMDREFLWRNVIAWKYGFEDGYWCSKKVRGSYGVGLWKSIMMGFKDSIRGVAFKVGDDKRSLTPS